LNNNVSVDLDFEAPTVSEYLKPRREGGLSAFSEEAATTGLEGSFAAVTLRSEGEAIGMGRIVGDGGCFLQIVDIAVDPRHRGKGLGKTIMTALMDHAKKTLPEPHQSRSRAFHGSRRSCRCHTRTS